MSQSNSVQLYTRPAVISIFNPYLLSISTLDSASNLNHLSFTLQAHFNFEKLSAQLRTQCRCLCWPIMRIRELVSEYPLAVEMSPYWEVPCKSHGNGNRYVNFMEMGTACMEWKEMKLHVLSETLQLNCKFRYCHKMSSVVCGLSSSVVVCNARVLRQKGWR